MEKIYQIETRPVCRPENVVQGETYRFTVLTDGLIRLEYDEQGQFEDRATQTVLNRDFEAVDFTTKETEDELQIFTKRVHLIYNKKEFTSFGLSIQVLGNISNYHSIWHYGEEPEDLLGTARTLDRVDGACELEHGLVSRFGFSLFDDSRSLLLTEDGWVEPRRKDIQDIYFWGYGHDYRECLKDFYYLSGSMPMVPRFVLGNWWSRYFEYTEESYKTLIEEFERERIPFTVAVIDMDWHLTEVDPKYGSGWTGYTWNHEMFPDPKRFMDWLHEKGMKVTLNVHPADGVRAYEEMYDQMARAMGQDPEKEEKVNFDISDPEFLKAYLEILHRPNEEKGVDFWWIDWQQGKNSKIEGLDPLWMLNHYHFLDNSRDGKRPLVFSRYAGPGSHRYPVGFSGDTYITWGSLDFQPYFTVTASNIGYGWWSHDIGGHMRGYKNDEMMARWLQFGVFSPVNRLHSTKDLFYSKEPWFFNEEVRKAMGNALRLRHQLIPYLYTMNYRACKEGLPLMEPMYYSDPEEEDAYQVPNQYWFGTELLAAPITEKNIPELHMGKVKVWLPQGTYIDFFNGMIYEGGRNIIMYRDIQNIPVMAKAGAIIPMTEEIYGKQPSSNPKQLTVRVYPGADGAFELYEDDNESQDYQRGICAITKMQWSWSEKRFVIYPVQGVTGLIPATRSYQIEVRGCTESSVTLSRNDIPEACETTYYTETKILVIKVERVHPGDKLELQFDQDMELQAIGKEKRVFDFLNRAEISYVLKRKIYDLVCGCEDAGRILGELRAEGIDQELFDCISEMIIAR